MLWLAPWLAVANVTQQQHDVMCVVHSAYLLESGEGGAEFVDSGVGDGLADRLVDLALHVRRQLVHRARSRAHHTTASRTPSVAIL